MTQYAIRYTLYAIRYTLYEIRILATEGTESTCATCAIGIDDTHPHTKESLNNLIDPYKAWNKPEKAKDWRVRLSQREAVEE